MTKTPDDIHKLLNLKTGDEIWTCMRFPVFSTEDGYFGHYTWGDDCDPYHIHCIEGKSPTVFKPVKLFYEGRFDAAESIGSRVFVFANCLNPTSSCDRFMLPLYYEGYKPPELQVDAKIFDHLVSDKHLLRFDRVHFKEEDCLEKCRKLNSSWQFCSGIGTYGKWYMKTINKIKKELAECMKAEWVVDPKKKIEEDLKLKETDEV